MAIFGMKNKKLHKFGHKVAKAGVFGAKLGGRLAFSAGTMLGNPQLMAAGAGLRALGEGIEKI